MDVKAVIFTHISLPDIPSIHDAERDGSLSSLVWSKWGEMLAAYASCPQVKLVYLFLSDAYIAYVTENNQFMDLKRLELVIEAELVEAIRRNCGQSSVSKFSLVGISQLQPLLLQLSELSNNLTGTSFKKLVLGGGAELFYDSPKVVEAIIRIARRDKNEAILRFDQDVVIDSESIAALIDEYNSQRALGKKYFFFSGSYRRHDRNHEPELFWLNDFAVRTQFLSEPVGENFRLNVEVAEKFISGLPSIGPDVYNQPISGAGLCISPMAVVQLPPFANVGRNIVWIDDAIKRALHVGIFDIAPNSVREVPHAKFLQDRHGGPAITQENINWGYDNYLPRLIHGCLMHSAMVDLGGVTPEGTYARYFMDYMRAKSPPSDVQRGEWVESILSRLSDMHTAWSANEFKKSPASNRLTTLAKEVLDINKAGCMSVIGEIVKNPTKNTDSLCKKQGLTPGRNAASYVCDVVVDLERYVDLMNIWPYIIRTVDFELRGATQGLEWLALDV